MGVKSALKLKTIEPERGRRRRVCQSTRRWMRDRSRDGNLREVNVVLKWLRGLCALEDGNKDGEEIGRGGSKSKHIL